MGKFWIDLLSDGEAGQEEYHKPINAFKQQLKAWIEQLPDGQMPIQQVL